MKLKDKIKSYSFWVSIASAVILILKVLGSRFGFVVDESMVSDIFTALCSILVLMGIIVVPSQQDTSAQIKPSKTQTPLKNQSKVFQEKQNDEPKNNIENSAYKNLDEQKQEDENQNCNSQMIDCESQNNSKNEQENLQTTTAETSQTTQDSMQENTLEKADDTQTSFQTDTQPLDDAEMKLIAKTDNQVSTQPLEETETQQIVEADDQVSTQPLNEVETQQIGDSDTQTNEGLVFQTINQNEENSSFIGDDKDNKLNSEELKTNENFDNILNLKNLFNSEREKFANNINDYILELQEEIRKTRERM